VAAAEGPPRCGAQDCLAGTRWIDRGRDIACRTDDAAAPDQDCDQRPWSIDLRLSLTLT